MLVGFAELIANIGRNTRFDATRAHGNHDQTDRQQVSWLDHVRDRRAHQRQSPVPKAVNNRKPENDLELSKERVGQNRAQQRKEIKHRDERVIPGLGRGGRHHAQMTHLIEQILRHEDRED